MLIGRPFRLKIPGAPADKSIEEGCATITLTRLNRGPFLLNPDLIEHLEMTPDTVINLTTGHQFIVRESAEEVVARIIEFRRAIYKPLFERLFPNDGRRPESAC